MKNFILLFISLAFLLSVKNGIGQEYEKSSALNQINVDIDHAQKKNIYEVFKSVRIVPLSARGDGVFNSHIDEIDKVVCLDDRIVIFELLKSRLSFFSKTGDFIKSIPDDENPNESLRASDIIANPKKNTIEVLCIDDNSIRIYDAKANFIREYRLPSFLGFNFAKINDDEYAFYDISQSNKFLIHIYSTKENKIVKDYLSKTEPYYKERKMPGIFLTEGIEQTFFSPPYSDTVYRINKKGELKADIFFDFGKWQTPKEAYLDWDKYKNLNVIRETGKFMEFPLMRYYYIVAKPGNTLLLRENEIFYGSLLFPVTDKHLVRPFGKTKTELIYGMSAVSLIEIYKSLDAEKKEALNTEFPDFAKMLESLNENSNPILFFCN